MKRPVPRAIVLFAILVGLEIATTFLNRRYDLPCLVHLEGLSVPVVFVALFVMLPRVWWFFLAAALAFGLNLCWPLDLGPPQLRVEKSTRTLYWGQQRLHVGLGPTSGPKERNGDGKTPEGEYYLCSKESTSDDRWMGLSYPNVGDAWRGRRQGLLTWLEFSVVAAQNRLRLIPWQSTRLGGAIGIHNGGEVTAGCIGLRMEQLDVLYPNLPLGTCVRVLP